MSTKRIGEFVITVDGPYPCWIGITHSRSPKGEIRFHHNELGDLRYGLEWAAHEARAKLREDRHEVKEP